ncbi:tetratricopeptide (TPR) repeat protein [Catenuloplanes nepalensis]|uniref:Tetratricopeptide (TPR) repeat protein n=1 Tax=Catenuloplanes nepalensis TaxID=587533 RepID=A0ABT9MVI5_9ACTN|nr:zeta toxin family protein [Catenuloplanes nepalensis]MDP9795394.1 tetratricopeptide (TPR) repeat protein [Catenuloplanes nepalensis]
MIEIGAILASEAARTVVAAALGASVTGAGRLMALLKNRIPWFSRRAAGDTPDQILGGTDESARGDASEATRRAADATGADTGSRVTAAHAGSRTTGVTAADGLTSPGDVAALAAEIERAIAADPALAEAIAAALPGGGVPPPAVPSPDPMAFHDRAEARARLAAPGVWVVGGAPGAGKTALLRRVAADVADGGVAYLDLDDDALRLGDQLDLDAARCEILRQFGLPSADPARYPQLLARGRHTLLLDNARGEAEIAPLVAVSPAARVLVSTRRLGDDFRRARPRAIVALGGLDPDGAWEMLAARVSPAMLAAEPEAAHGLLEAADRMPYGIQQIAARLSRRSGEPGALASELAALRTTGDRDEFLDLMVSRAIGALSASSRDGLALLTRYPGDGFTRDGATALLGPLAVATLTELDDLSLLDRAPDGRLRLFSLVRRRAHLLPTPSDVDGALLRLLGHHVSLGVAADVALTRPDRLRAYPVPPDAEWPLPVPPLDWLAASAGTLFALTAQAHHRGRHHDVLRLCGTLEVLHLHRGHHERCDAAFRDGVASAAALGDPLAQARLTASRGRIALLRGRLTEAADLLDAAHNLLAEARARGLDTVRFDASLAEFRARLAEQSGDLPAAVALLRAALEADRAADWSYSRGIHARMLANVLVKAKLPGDALAAADEAAAHTADRRNAGRVATVRAKALLALGWLPAAGTALTAAREAVAGTTQYDPELDEIEGDLALATGDRATAHAAWSRVVDRALKLGDDRAYAVAMQRLTRLRT